MPLNSKVHIRVDKRGDRSVLQSAFFTTPYKVLDITEDKKGACLNLMLMSNSPGILEGDEVNLQVDMATGSKLALHTQGYQRIYEMKVGARQNLLVNLCRQASFRYLPHPTVPQQRSILQVENIFCIDATSQLVYGEVITCGRKHSGESFRFTRYQSLTKIFIDGKLMIRENLLMQPGVSTFDEVGYLEGYSHQANLVIIGFKTLPKEEIGKILQAEKNVESGVTEIFPGAKIVRLLGYGSEQLYNCMQRIADAILLQQNPGVVK